MIRSDDRRPLRPPALRRRPGRRRRLFGRARGAPRWAQARPLDLVRLPADRGTGTEPDVPPLRDRLARPGPPPPPPPPARASLAPPLLGPRLQESTAALLALDPSLSAERILGGIDAMKLRSSMTLFA